MSQERAAAERSAAESGADEVLSLQQDPGSDEVEAHVETAAVWSATSLALCGSTD